MCFLLGSNLMPFSYKYNSEKFEPSCRPKTNEVNADSDFSEDFAAC